MLLINIAGNRTTLTVIENDEIIYNKTVKSYTDVVKKIHRVCSNYEIKKYVVAKSGKVINSELQEKLNFKEDLKIILGDIRLIKSNI